MTSQGAKGKNSWQYEFSRREWFPLTVASDVTRGKGRELLIMKLNNRDWPPLTGVNDVNYGKGKELLIIGIQWQLQMTSEGKEKELLIMKFSILEWPPLRVAGISYKLLLHKNKMPRFYEMSLPTYQWLHGFDVFFKSPFLEWLFLNVCQLFLMIFV